MVLSSLAHDCILANIAIGFYNKLLFYLVLFTFGHDFAHAYYDKQSQHRVSKARDQAAIQG